MGVPSKTARKFGSGGQMQSGQWPATRLALNAPPVYKPVLTAKTIAGLSRPSGNPAQAADGSPAPTRAFPGARPNPAPGIQPKSGTGPSKPAAPGRMNEVQSLVAPNMVTARPPVIRPTVARCTNTAQADFAPGFKCHPGAHSAARAGAPSAAQQKPASSYGALQPKLPPGIEAFHVNLQQRPGGWTLPKEVQAKMEDALGADFSDVRIHVGPEVSALGAIAFTWGSNIHFAPGYYSPHTPHGQQLLAHELTHVLQQRAGRVRNPYGNGVAVVQDAALEAEADRMGRQALQPKFFTPGR